MITKNQIISLGYTVKPENIDMYDGSTDFKYVEMEIRPYLVNLREGIITIVFPINSQRNSFSTGDFKNFQYWHNHFKV